MITKINNVYNIIENNKYNTLHSFFYFLFFYFFNEETSYCYYWPYLKKVRPINNNKTEYDSSDLLCETFLIIVSYNSCLQFFLF